MDDYEGTGTYYTVDEALASMGFGKFQAFLLGYAGLGSFAEAMEMMILSFVGPLVKSQWGLSSTQESLLTTAVFAGMLIGAYSWGLLSDNYGRRQAFLSFFLSFFFFFFLFFPVMIILPRLSWRWLLAISSLPSISLLLLYPLVPESPRYLCLKGKVSDARGILEKIALRNQTKLPAGMLISGNTAALFEESSSQEYPPRASTTGKTILALKSSFSTFFMLFSSKLIRTTVLLWVLFFGNAFSYYGIILLTSELSSGQSKCSSSTILHLESSKDDRLYIDVFITSLAEVPGLLLSAVLVDRVGRKLSMAMMFVLACISLLPLISHQSAYVTTALLFGARMCAIGTFTVASIYAPELYPTSARTTGAGAANAVGRIGGMVCPLVAVGLVTGCGLTKAIVLFEVVIAMSAICALLFPFETKGRELTENFCYNRL
ncbi:hypothetical protein Tsubulata_024523 [Turnera subulata]|uniref:Major facilitator superfamily (MFS) profile domain-containing protein n=1 Tax=Turnera subulata TaxID=218843 RepID=A0A9Q0J5L9_9ROSI|nr:hypothetical protein Tsubulata_024523 [Turnera subulata]